MGGVFSMEIRTFVIENPAYVSFCKSFCKLFCTPWFCLPTVLCAHPPCTHRAHRAGTAWPANPPSLWRCGGSANLCAGIADGRGGGAGECTAGGKRSTEGAYLCGRRGMARDVCAARLGRHLHLHRLEEPRPNGGGGDALRQTCGGRSARGHHGGRMPNLGAHSRSDTAALLHDGKLLLRLVCPRHPAPAGYGVLRHHHPLRRSLSARLA